MGPIRYPETSVKDHAASSGIFFFLDLLTFEDGTDTLSRNVGKGLPRSVEWYFFFLDFLTFEDGTDTLSRNVGKGSRSVEWYFFLLGLLDL
jgi:hypothetical protein